MLTVLNVSRHPVMCCTPKNRRVVTAIVIPFGICGIAPQLGMRDADVDWMSNPRDLRLVMECSTELIFRILTGGVVEKIICVHLYVLSAHLGVLT